MLERCYYMGNIQQALPAQDTDEICAPLCARDIFLGSMRIALAALPTITDTPPHLSNRAP